MSASDLSQTGRMNQDVGEDPRRRPSAAELQPGLGYELHAVGRAMRRRFERSIRQVGLQITRLQAALLLYIARNPGVGQTATARDFDLEPIALVRILDRLHEEGLVERHAHPTDRRARTLWLTPVAWSVVEQILKVNIALRAETCAGLSTDERRELMRVLCHMKRNLEAAESTNACQGVGKARK